MRMHWPRNICLFSLMLVLSVRCMAASAPAAPAQPARAAAPTAVAIPDYGGRDAPGLLSGAGADAPNPLAQAGRSLLALIVVLGGVVGTATLLKRAGYSGGPVAPALLTGLRKSLPPSAKTGNAGAAPGPGEQNGQMVLVQSQALPGGGAVHLLTVNDRTMLLIGATAQHVTRIAEWEWEPEEEPVAAVQNTLGRSRFSEHLARADSAPLVSPPAVSRRISDLLANGRGRTTEEKPE
jgi:hypothetical protein